MCIIKLLDINRLMHIKDIKLIFKKIKPRKEVSFHKVMSYAKALSPRQGHCQHHKRFLARVIRHYFKDILIILIILF